MAQRPIHEIRLGRIKAAIWRNETESGTRHNVTLSRVYKTDSGWESTESFGRDDLLLVAKVADLAHSWIHQQDGDQENGKVEKRVKNADDSKRTQSAEGVAF